jgi:hypothetical protein
MIVPFLFTMGLYALSHAAKTYGLQLTDILPVEERVQITHLSNGIKTYVQEHDTPAQCGSFRVVLRKASSEEELYRYDGAVKSLDSIEQFFSYCKGKVSVDSIEIPPSLKDLNFTSSYLPSIGAFNPQEIAVVAVGDFPVKEMQLLIEKHFGSLNLAHKPFVEEDLIQIGNDPKISKVALNLAYPIASQSIQTYSDLKEAWKFLLLQDIFQRRLEYCSRGLEEVWVHPHPRFFYPVKGYSLVPQEDCENLLAFFLWQVESIRSDGFYEDEFYVAKYKLLNQLQYLASQSSSPDDAFLASYFADQFLLGESCLSPQSFMNASIQFIEEIKIQDLIPCINSFLFEKNRSIQVAYPMLTHAELLTKDRIEEVIKKVAALASFYRNSEISEDKIWTLDTKQTKSLPICLAEAPKSALTIITPKPEKLPLAKNFVIAIDNTTGAEAPFYQLPITQKEKRIIHTIITTMAEKNILQLAFVKRSMEKKGKKIEHIHPLRFMGYILSSSELRSCLRAIKKSSFKWDAFIGGFSRRMREEHANDNLYIHVPGFCQQIGSDQELVKRFIHKKDWEGLIEKHL